MILDDDRAYGEAWAATGFAERRRITRAVNKGEPLDDGFDAQLAVMTARRQLTFWRYGWLVGPAVTLLQWGNDLSVFIASMVASGLVTGGLSLFFIRRANRAIHVNLPAAEKMAAKGRRKAGAKGSGRPHPKSREAEHIAAVAQANLTWWQRLRARD